MLGRQASRRRRHRLTPVIHCVCAELSVQNSRRGPGVYIPHNWPDTHIAAGMRSAKESWPLGSGDSQSRAPLSALLKLGQRPPAALGQGEHDPEDSCPRDSTSAV
jgi:hypothetical protein